MLPTTRSFPRRTACSVEQDLGLVDKDIKNPGIWLAKVIPFPDGQAVRQWKKGDLVNRRWLKHPTGKGKNKKYWIGDNCAGKSSWNVLQVEWMKGSWDKKENCIVYIPEMVNRDETGKKLNQEIPYRTLVWENMLRTHGPIPTKCPPLATFELVHHEKHNKKHGDIIPIKVKQEHFMKFIIRCKRDEFNAEIFVFMYLNR